MTEPWRPRPSPAGGGHRLAAASDAPASAGTGVHAGAGTDVHPGAVADTAAAAPAETAERTPPVHIRVLGPLAVTVDGEPVPAGGPTQRRLAIALAASALDASALTADELIDAVYGEELPPRPRRSLATLVWRLRRLWGADAIVSDGYAYRLDPARCAVDAQEFETLVYRGRALARDGDRARGVEVLQAALATWSDPSGPDPATPAPERLRLTELRLGAMDHLAQLLAESGATRTAVEWLEQVVTARPEWEHSQARLIDCHLAIGHVADGLRVYDSARRVLADQGVEPGPDLSAAAARLTVAASSPSVPLPGLPSGLPTGPAGEADLLGPSGPAGAVPRPRAPSEAGRTARRPSPDSRQLVGRQSELDDVVAAVTAAVVGRTSTAILVSGEPGIGKTTVVRAAVAVMGGDEDPAGVVELACDPRRTLPYAPLVPLAPEAPDGPWASLLGDGGVGSPDGIVDHAAQIHGALVRRVRDLAGASGLVLVIEDLHWASGETVDAVAALLAGTTDLPVVALCTTRATVPPPGLAVHVGRHVRLRGLDDRGVAEIVGGRPGSAEVARMRRATGGNPLYLRQLQRAGSRGLRAPHDGLEAAIEAHLGLVSPLAVDALEVAAVVGDRFGLAVLTALTGCFRHPRPVWVDRLALAVRSGLVEPDPARPGEFTFVHTLIREHLYQRMDAGRRTAAHADIGRALGRLALGRPCPADLLAHHYTRGWPETTTREVVDRLSAAARAAAAQLDFAQAEAHYRAALDHLAMDPGAATPDEVAQILGVAAGAAAAGGDLAAANELYESQRHCAERAGLVRAHLYASLGALRTQYTRRVRPQVADNLADALGAAADRGVLREVPHLAGEALAAVQVYRPHRVRELFATIGAAAPDLVTGLQVAVWEHRTVADQLAAARRLAGDPGADPIAVWLRLWVAEVAAGLRPLDEAPSCPVPLSRADDQTRFDISQWRIAGQIATGRLSRAHRLIDAALAAPRHQDPAENARRVASFYGQRTMLALIEDRLPDPQQSPLIANPTWASRHPIMRYVGAYMLALKGERDRARDLCDDLLDEVADGDIPESDLLPRLMLLTDACLRAGHDPGLEPCLANLLPHRGEHGIFRFGQYWGAADESIGGLQVALGELDGGIASLRGAIAQFDAIHATVYSAISRRSLADALQRRGSRGERAEIAALRWQADAIDRRIGLLHRLSHPESAADPDAEEGSRVTFA